MIHVSNLTKFYGDYAAIRDVNFEVERGQVVGFLGPNGAGKTTTLRMIAGILKPTSGTIRVAGVDLQADPITAKSRLGFIPDRPFIYEKLTGAEFLRFVAGLYDQRGDEVEHRARELLALFDLEEWRDELVESYSHGMRQKLIISSAFVHRPEVIVESLAEITKMLDKTGWRPLWHTESSRRGREKRVEAAALRSVTL